RLHDDFGAALLRNADRALQHLEKILELSPGHRSSVASRYAVPTPPAPGAGLVERLRHCVAGFAAAATGRRDDDLRASDNMLPELARHLRTFFANASRTATRSAADRTAGRLEHLVDVHRLRFSTQAWWGQVLAVDFACVACLRKIAHDLALGFET